LCEHDIEVGECSGVFVRFGYDRASNDCRQFTYGGCGGNGNNFANIQECRNVCVKKVCNPNPQCDLARCQIVNDQSGCSDTPKCPDVDVGSCKDPCIVINNRKGCKDCICPTIPSSGQVPSSSEEEEDEEPAVAPPSPRTTSRPVTNAPLATGPPRPPATPTKVGPPAGPTVSNAAPPGSRDNRVNPRQGRSCANSSIIANEAG
ncbi:unnamed protein product, partial [Strongylus vulgaris]